MYISIAGDLFCKIKVGFVMKFIDINFEAFLKVATMLNWLFWFVKSEKGDNVIFTSKTSWGIKELNYQFLLSVNI
jgi:hypothetical protein